MLVMWDRGLYAYDQVKAVRERGAQVLCRLSASVKPKAVEYLSDGSYLAYIYPADYQRRKRGERPQRRVHFTLLAKG
jgi:thioester reductase-like protein